ncbi:hypothetical protein [Leptolyngbya sp. FACHB-711]|nr:hypothetical protein [Leptolyngbya sp. FACHB-711]
MSFPGAAIVHPSPNSLQNPAFRLQASRLKAAVPGTMMNFQAFSET